MNDRETKAVLFIPARNEAERIEAAVKRWTEALSVLADRKVHVEVLVVDDGSSDKTAEAAQGAGARVVAHPYPLGPAAATRTGIRAARAMGADVALKADTWTPLDPGTIEQTLMPVAEGRADVVVAGRFEAALDLGGGGAARRAIGALVRRVTGWSVTKAREGLIAYSRRYLDAFDSLEEFGFGGEIFVDTGSKNLTVVEAPGDMPGPGSDKSSNTMKLLRPASLLRIMIFESPIRVFTPVGFFSIAFAFALYLYKYMDPTYEPHLNTIVILIIAGVQTIFFGLLADLILKRR